MPTPKNPEIRGVRSSVMRSAVKRIREWEKLRRMCKICEVRVILNSAKNNLHRVSTDPYIEIPF